MVVDKTTVPLKALPRGSETILVVDDDDAVRALLSETLKMKGYLVLEARLNSAALLLAGRYEGPIHLMIADLIMPGVSGRELARRMEALRPEMKLLYISGHPRETVLGEKLLENDAVFLQKPINLETLLTKVRELLDVVAEDQDVGDGDFVRMVLRSLIERKENYQLSQHQIVRLQSLAGEYEKTRMTYEAEFLVAEMHVQTLVQDDASTLLEIEQALRKSEQAQSLARLEGVKSLRAAEALLTPEQREHVHVLYPHGKRRAPGRLDKTRCKPASSD
jgi:response regulator RpfG family c-di-GMP phosphodiesterase